jgi:hypothetical protein
MATQERRMNEHVAKRWVESKFPECRGPIKAMLIMSFGAGVNAGLAEAQEIIDEYVKMLRSA